MICKGVISCPLLVCAMFPLASELIITLWFNQETSLGSNPYIIIQHVFDIYIYIYIYTHTHTHTNLYLKISFCNYNMDPYVYIDII
jgi:hypothetical protein